MNTKHATPGEPLQNVAPTNCAKNEKTHIVVGKGEPLQTNDKGCRNTRLTNDKDVLCVCKKVYMAKAPGIGMDSLSSISGGMTAQWKQVCRQVH